jgi:hypothetical protein
MKIVQQGYKHRGAASPSPCHTHRVAGLLLSQTSSNLLSCLPLSVAASRLGPS